MEYGLTNFSCIISTKSQSFQFGNPNMYLDNNYLFNLKLQSRFYSLVQGQNLISDKLALKKTDMIIII